MDFLFIFHASVGKELQISLTLLACLCRRFDLDLLHHPKLQYLAYFIHLQYPVAIKTHSHEFPARSPFDSLHHGISLALYTDHLL